MVRENISKKQKKFFNKRNSNIDSFNIIKENNRTYDDGYKDGYTAAVNEITSTFNRIMKT